MVCITSEQDSDKQQETEPFSWNSLGRLLRGLKLSEMLSVASLLHKVLPMVPGLTRPTSGNQEDWEAARAQREAILEANLETCRQELRSLRIQVKTVMYLVLANGAASVSLIV